jgi:hypothetical protein
MKEWHSANEITKRSGLPGSTARRYLSTFEEFFISQQDGKQRRYDGESVSTLKRIAQLYEAKQTSADIKAILRQELNFMIIDVTDQEREQQNPTSIITHMEAQTSALMAALQTVTKGMAEILKENRENRSEIQTLTQRVAELEKQIQDTDNKKRRKWWLMFTR